MINVVKEINELLEYCVAQKISDIHIETIKAGIRVRLRKDGILREHKTYTLEQSQNYISRLKIMSGLDINNRNIQDGRFKYLDTDIRVSTLPVFWGEKIVLRLLFYDLALTLQDLGLSEQIEALLKKFLQKESGLILLTGPTGSGKTTTLYSLLKLLDCQKKNIITIEDPIEYQLDGINQVQVNYAQNIDFVKVLKAVLRQDPDIIFIGEIRDSETATIAFRAALTGHLVLATLHTRDTQETLVRLRDLGIADYLIKDTINCILSQRLFRKKCSWCKGNGCGFCTGEGFSGRKGIFEYYGPREDQLFSFKKAKEDILAQGLTTEAEMTFI